MVPPRGRYWRSCCLSCRSCCLFLYAAAAFLGLGFWLIRGIGFRGILDFLARLRELGGLFFVVWARGSDFGFYDSRILGF